MLQEGGQDRALYSARFPLPVFYLVEMTWPYNDIHPIALPIYILGLLGLGLWACRRKTEDKFFLTWFITVYVFFTLIPNKQWRYVTPVFPVLAISAASFIMFAYGKAAEAWKHKQISINKKRAPQSCRWTFHNFRSGFGCLQQQRSVLYGCTGSNSHTHRRGNELRG